MSEHELIVSNPAVLGGKAVIRGTRLSVELLQSLVAQGWTREDLLENYPSNTPEALAAALSYPASEARH